MGERSVSLRTLESIVHPESNRGIMAYLHLLSKVFSSAKNKVKKKEETQQKKKKRKRIRIYKSGIPSVDKGIITLLDFAARKMAKLSSSESSS